MARFRLLVGLGNFGRHYTATRHNAGFWWIDALTTQLGVTFLHETKFLGETAKMPSDVRLLKPMTYMNHSGRSVAALARFFDIAPGDILVAHDELDLLPGVARLKQGGGHAGHNGLRDIQQQLGASDFWRLRFGIGHPRDSEVPQQSVADYVLKPPRLEERRNIDDAIARALKIWALLEQGEMAQATMQLHTDPGKNGMVKAADTTAATPRPPAPTTPKESF